jgi:hypothetical protein
MFLEILPKGHPYIKSHSNFFLMTNPPNFGEVFELTFFLMSKDPAYPKRFLFWTRSFPWHRLAGWRRGDPVIFVETPSVGVDQKRIFEPMAL